MTLRDQYEISNPNDNALYSDGWEWYGTMGYVEWLEKKLEEARELVAAKIMHVAHGENHHLPEAGKGIDWDALYDRWMSVEFEHGEGFMSLFNWLKEQEEFKTK